MKKIRKILLGFSILAISISSYAYALEIGTEYGYSGLEIGANIVNINNKESNFLSNRYLEIENEINRTTSFLERDNLDKEKLLNFNYLNFNNKLYSTKTGELILGLSNYDSRIGIKLSFSKGNLKKIKNNDKKIEKLGGQIFYNFKEFEKSYSVIGFFNNTKLQQKKLEDAGINLKYKKIIDNFYFEYLEPSYFLQTSYIFIKEKHEDSNKNKNRSLTSDIGLEFKNKVDIGETAITTKLYISYEREYLGNKKYTNIEKYKDLDKVVSGINFDVKVNEILNFYFDGKIKKSLQSSKNSIISSVGIKISF